MIELILRFLAGGVIVSAFALLADLLQPKSFAGLFAAAPSVALATIPLTIYRQGAAYSAVEARSMIAGSVAFFVYACAVAWLIQRYRFSAALAATSSLVLWAAVAFGLDFVCQ
jgi:uncharacterized membrane protein (GlpM family)